MKASLKSDFKRVPDFDLETVYGMGLDLAGTLAVMGTVFVGDPLSLDPGFSIGGESSEAENLLDNGLGLLGK
jgi:hypothetical protein